MSNPRFRILESNPTAVYDSVQGLVIHTLSTEDAVVLLDILGAFLLSGSMVAEKYLALAEKYDELADKYLELQSTVADNKELEE